MQFLHKWNIGRKWVNYRLSLQDGIFKTKKSQQRQKYRLPLVFMGFRVPIIMASSDVMKGINSQISCYDEKFVDIVEISIIDTPLCSSSTIQKNFLKQYVMYKLSLYYKNPQQQQQQQQNSNKIMMTRNILATFNRKTTSQQFKESKSEDWCQHRKDIEKI